MGKPMIGGPFKLVDHNDRPFTDKVSCQSQTTMQHVLHAFATKKFSSASLFNMCFETANANCNRKSATPVHYANIVWSTGSAGAMGAAVFWLHLLSGHLPGRAGQDGRSHQRCRFGICSPLARLLIHCIAWLAGRNERRCLCIRAHACMHASAKCCASERYNSLSRVVDTDDGSVCGWSMQRRRPAQKYSLCSSVLIQSATQCSRWGGEANFTFKANFTSS